MQGNRESEREKWRKLEKKVGDHFKGAWKSVEREREKKNNRNENGGGESKPGRDTVTKRKRQNVFLPVEKRNTPVNSSNVKTWR